MIRMLELFGGYGSQALVLENLGIEFISDLCDIDKYAEKAYNQIHGETFNYGDICSIDETKLPYYDLITYSSPCQDFSQAGKQAGGEKGSGTRSSLLWECERIIRAVKPKYLLMENVKALTSKKFMPLFANWLNTLEELGYKNWWKVLNAKDYGVPQNRERVFVVSILGGGSYQFPEPIKLEKRLKDVLEQKVDEKYYINKPFNAYPDGTSRTIKAQYYKNSTSNFERTDSFGATGVLEPVCCASRGRNPDNPSDRITGSPTEQRLEVNQNGTTNTITTVQKDNYVIVPEATKQGYAKAYEGDSINLEQPNSQTRRGRVGHQMANTLTCSCNQGVVEPMALDEQNRYVRKDGCVGTLTTDGSSPKHNNRVIEPKVINPLAGKSDYGWHFEQEVYDEKGIARAVKAGGGSGNIPKVMQVGNIVHTGNFENPQRGRIYSSDGCSPALNTCTGGGLEPKIIDDTYANRMAREYTDSSPSIRAERSGFKVVEPKIAGMYNPYNKREIKDIAPTQTTNCDKSTNSSAVLIKYENYRIRKLTPRECWRLMGVRDYQYDKLHDISNAQLYKMAGNSIVVDVLMAIFKNLFMPTEQKGQLELL